MNGGQGSVSWSNLGLVDLQPLGEDSSLSGDESSNTSLGLNSLNDALHVLKSNLERWVADVDQKNLVDLSSNSLLDAVLVSTNDLDFLQLSLEFLLGLAGQVVEDGSDFLLDSGGFSLKG